GGINLVSLIQKCVETNPATGCWIWGGHKNASGYGIISVGDKNHMAHRLSYELFNAPIPEGYEVDHLCKRPSCCCPNHLEAVTSLENMRRSRLCFKMAVRAMFRTHCESGKHEWTEDNIRRHKSGRGYCRLCCNERKRERDAKHGSPKAPPGYWKARWIR